jgi:glycerate 2-kinase
MEPCFTGAVKVTKRTALLDIFKAALQAVDPYRAVTRVLRSTGRTLDIGGTLYDRTSFDRIIVLGAGKATARMAEAVEKTVGKSIAGGLIIVKYGHRGNLSIIEQIEAGHPIPDEAGMRGTARILEIVRSADEKTLVLCLLSGGGSALLVSPLPGITLEDKQVTTDLLLKAGADINELNTVRKHLSAIKGGRLVQAAYPASVATLILSDVIGDRLDVIASGPTVPDSSTYTDAELVISRYGLASAVPPRVTALIERGSAGREKETAKSGDACFTMTQNVIVGGITLALEAARAKAAFLGYNTEIHTAELKGESRVVALALAKAALRIRSSMKQGEKRCLLSGGETTVTVRGKGKGGRNQELALAFALEISGLPGITLLSAGTDGTDGPTDAAGAVVDGFTAQKARECGIPPEAYLENNDSYAFFHKTDSACGLNCHVLTGPTGTNVMDIHIILIEG